MGIREFKRLESMNFRDWLDNNIKGVANTKFGRGWPMIFAITTWWIWRWRNDYVFNNVEKDHADKIRWIYTQATETRNAFRNTTVLNQNNAAPSTFKLTWEQPSDGWYVLNTDGSFGSGANNGSCAGVVRDSRGNWCGGFGFRIPATSVALTEAWAILKGVEWAWRKGFRKLIVQSDSKRVIDWIDGTSTPRGPICNIIEKCKSWKKNNWEISFKHIFREQNIVADTLVKHIKASNTTWVEWEEPPHSVEEALLFDLSVVPYERLISEERIL
nr:uncharacterized protein LOC109149189 [Ipomoea batatas]